LFVSYIPDAAGDRWDIVITEILAGYYEPDELVLPPLSGSCSPALLPALNLARHDAI